MHGANGGLLVCGSSGRGRGRKAAGCCVDRIAQYVVRCVLKIRCVNELSGGMYTTDTAAGLGERVCNRPRADVEGMYPCPGRIAHIEEISEWAVCLRCCRDNGQSE